MFRVTVEEIKNDLPPGASDGAVAVKRFEQCVDTIDMRRLIDAVNYKPRVRKTKGEKS